MPLFFNSIEPVKVVLVHGTQNLDGQQQIVEWVTSLAELLDTKLRIAWLECCEPTLTDVLLDCALEGKNVILLPLLLFRAGHAKKDVPFAIRTVQQSHPNFKVDMASVVGDAEVLMECWKLTIKKLNPQCDRICFFGRGAKDPEAVEACVKVIEAVSQFWSGELVEAYAGLQKPSLIETLSRHPFTSGEQLFLPCILFKGKLLDQAYEQTQNRGTWLPVLGEIPEFMHATAKRWQAEIQLMLEQEAK